MAKNYSGACTYDLIAVTCTPPKEFPNIKGAILYASFVSGPGYLPDSPDLADRNLFLGGMVAGLGPTSRNLLAAQQIHGKCLRSRGEAKHPSRAG